MTNEKEDEKQKTLIEQAMDENQIGKIFVKRDFFKTYPDKVIELFSRSLIIKCNYEFSKDGLVYEMYDSRFPKMDPAFYPPEYQLEIEIDNEGNLKDIWIEID